MFTGDSLSRIAAGINNDYFLLLDSFVLRFYACPTSYGKEVKI